MSGFQEEIETFTINILDEDYSLLISKFDEHAVEERTETIEEIGLSDLSVIPNLMEHINVPIGEYPTHMWDDILDVYILLDYLGFLI